MNAGAMQDVFELRGPASSGAEEWHALRAGGGLPPVRALGWHELIYNHLTVRVPGSEHFLINPFGLMYREITASNLVKIDLEGRKVEPSPGR